MVKIVDKKQIKVDKNIYYMETKNKKGKGGFTFNNATLPSD